MKSVSTAEAMRLTGASARILHLASKAGCLLPILHRGANHWTLTEIHAIRLWTTWTGIESRGGTFRREALVAWRAAEHPKRGWIVRVSRTAKAATERDFTDMRCMSELRLDGYLKGLKTGNVEIVHVRLDRPEDKEFAS